MKNGQQYVLERNKSYILKRENDSNKLVSKTDIFKLIEGFIHNVLTIVRLYFRTILTNVILFQHLLIFAVRFPQETVFISIGSNFPKTSPFIRMN